MSYRDSDNFDVAAERDYVEACDYFDSLDGQDVSEYDDEPEYADDEPWDGFRDDVEADADTLASAGYGTDEDYGCYGEACDNGWD